jgi:hypothetical protein
MVKLNTNKNKNLFELIVQGQVLIMHRATLQLLDHSVISHLLAKKMLKQNQKTQMSNSSKS